MKVVKLCSEERKSPTLNTESYSAQVFLAVENVQKLTLSAFPLQFFFSDKKSKVSKIL